jgi:hypothetical protein
MNSAKLARGILAGCLWIAGCGGAATARPRPHGAHESPVSSDAPSWAEDGDSADDDGALFVCQGEGPDEAQAMDAARALCTAKICARCGVEVKATVETHETLEKVEVERKVVETCRRVRKSEDEIRYRQAGCGPEGCSAWLSVYYSRETEARECRAYADGNYADSGQCEALIEQFRSTPGLSAASFRARAALLSQAVVACAEIDVRPTPKLTALDEILWQGVVTPRAEPLARRVVDDARPIKERLDALAGSAAEAWKSEYAEQAYHAIDRQPLLESKVFVDRIAHIRDAMLGYASIITAMEALVDAEHAPDAAHATALVRALRGLMPVAGKATPARVLAWAADEISRNPRTLALPGVKAYFMEMYPSSADAVGEAVLRTFTVDGAATADEWRFAMDEMRGCVRCATSLLDLPEHGGDATRIARVTELTRTLSTDAHVAALQEVDPALLLRAEPTIDGALAARVFSYAWLKRWLERLPTVGRDSTPHTVRDTYASGPQDFRWTVTPAEHKNLAARAFRLLQAQVATVRCSDLEKELTLVELHGVDTRALEPVLCRCVSTQPHSGMRDVTELYQRLVAWGAACVAKEIP